MNSLENVQPPAREARQVNGQELEAKSSGFASQSKAASPSFMGLSRELALGKL